MEFPQGCTDHADRLGVVYGVLSQLLEEREAMRLAIGTNGFTVAEFKKWEKETWRPMQKHAFHLKNQYKRILKLNPKGEEELSEDKKALKDTLKQAGRDRLEGKNKDWFKDKKSKDLVAPWNVSMNTMYAGLQAEAEAAEKE